MNPFIQIAEKYLPKYVTNINWLFVSLGFAIFDPLLAVVIIEAVVRIALIMEVADALTAFGVSNWTAILISLVTVPLQVLILPPFDMILVAILYITRLISGKDLIRLILGK